MRPVRNAEEYRDLLGRNRQLIGASRCRTSRVWFKSIDLSQPAEQVAFYDQGIGTDPRHVNEVQGYKDKRTRAAVRADRARPAVPRVVDPALRSREWPAWRSATVSRRNVKELYKALAGCYDGQGDSIYLFGFSRGAFTVRVLAGLILRCGLLPKDAPDFDATFETGLRPVHASPARTSTPSQRFKRDEHVRIAARALPRHLGHGQVVRRHLAAEPSPPAPQSASSSDVRHALALDEQRSWFLPTSWGGIDSDRPMDDPRYRATQNDRRDLVPRLHSDVGGGFEDDAAARIPLRWMLNEAATCGPPSQSGGTRSRRVVRSRECPALHDSLTGGWLFTEYLPRWELDNSTSTAEALLQVRTNRHTPSGAVLPAADGPRCTPSVGADARHRHQLRGDSGRIASRASSPRRGDHLSMAIRIVRLGSPRASGEGLRLGTVRRPPRGVPKAETASRDFYDVWLPDVGAE